jgi:NAD(P)-dependent dehydrogenase (short-subunit alcohol dehydrogenase family)
VADGSPGAVVVTGSSTGIGRACALELDRRGFAVFAGIRKEADAEALRAVGSGRLRPLIIDVTSRIRSRRPPGSSPRRAPPGSRGW